MSARPTSCRLEIFFGDINDHDDNDQDENDDKDDDNDQDDNEDNDSFYLVTTLLPG